MRANALIIGLLGLWLILAGIIGLGQMGNMWNDWIVGLVVAILGFAMVGRAPGGILCGILGLWMMVSAFIPDVHAGAGARLDDIIVGIILAIVGFATPRKGLKSTSHIDRAA